MPTLEFRAMGCRILATVDAETRAATRALEEVPGWFAAWEKRLSRFRDDSELSRLNACGGEPTTVSPTLGEVLDLAMLAARWTDGLVVPTVLPALEAAGYDRPFEALAPSATTLRPPALPSPAVWREIEWEPTSRRVRLPPGARLDLGGIAKGWAAERAARRLARVGPALVDAGGDVAVSGPRPAGEGWAIAVADPSAPGCELALLALTSGVVATSGRDYRRWQQAGAWHHHIVDPRTGRPAHTDVVTATGVAPTAWQAEAAAKAALILGGRDGLVWIDRHPPLGALLALEDGSVLRNRRLNDYLWG